MWRGCALPPRAVGPMLPGPGHAEGGPRGDRNVLPAAGLRCCEWGARGTLCLLVNYSAWGGWGGWGLGPLSLDLQS